MHHIYYFQKFVPRVKPHVWTCHREHSSSTGSDSIRAQEKMRASLHQRSHAAGGSSAFINNTVPCEHNCWSTLQAGVLHPNTKFKDKIPSWYLQSPPGIWKVISEILLSPSEMNLSFYKQLFASPGKWGLKDHERSCELIHNNHVSERGF